MQNNIIVTILGKIVQKVSHATPIDPRRGSLFREACANSVREYKKAHPDDTTDSNVLFEKFFNGDLPLYPMD